MWKCRVCKPFARKLPWWRQPAGREYVRQMSVKNGEEKYKAAGTYGHFDGINDRAGDKANTRYLLSQKWIGVLTQTTF